MRRLLKDVLPFLLRNAPEHSEDLAVPVFFFELLQPAEHLLFRLVADAAGVVQNQVRLFRRGNLRVPLRDERSNHLFGIVNVHLTAERFDVEGFHASRSTY